jgi:hypothetical protein
LSRASSRRVSSSANPLFPALRSAPTAVSRASRRKQIPSSFCHHLSPLQGDKTVIVELTRQQRAWTRTHPRRAPNST